MDVSNDVPRILLRPSAPEPRAFGQFPTEPMETPVGCHWFTASSIGGTQWLETSTIRQRNITRMLPNPTALLRNNMAKATMQRARNIHLTPSNTHRMLDSPASKPTTRANSKSKS
jgi:hypothetical protein